MDLSIVIVNFRTIEVTRDCLNSLKKHINDISWEVILVDNGSSENQQSLFEDIFPGIIYIQSEENIGFSRANNLGIKKAKGQYILLLNSDTLVLDDSIQQCFHFMEQPQASSVGLLGCKLLNEDRTYQPSFYPFTKDSIWNFLCVENPLLFKLTKVSKRYIEPQQSIPVGDISGAFMLLRRKVVEKANAFDPDFFLYCEETEWCRNRIAKYYTICYFPQAQVVHLGGQSTPKSFLFAQSRLSLSLAWYKKGWIDYLLYILCCYLNLFFFILLFFFLKNKGYYKEYIKTYFQLIPSLIFEIPSYSRSYGSRPEPLIFKRAKGQFK